MVNHFWYTAQISSSIEDFKVIYSPSCCDYLRRTEHIVKMSMEASIKIVNFVTPGAAVPVLECGHFDVKVKMYFFFWKTILCTLIWPSCIIDKLSAHSYTNKCFGVIPTNLFIQFGHFLENGQDPLTLHILGALTNMCPGVACGPLVFLSGLYF